MVQPAPSCRTGQAPSPTEVSRGHQLRAAFWELYLHEAFDRLGFAITHELDVPGSTRHPDFLLTRDDEEFYVEAVMVLPSDKDVSSDQRKNAIYESLDKMRSPNFALWLEVNREGESSPTVKKLRSDLESWLATLDPDEVMVQHEPGKLESLPTRAWTLGEWQITFWAIPKKPEARRSSDIRPLGAFGPGEATMVDDVTPIRSTLETKGSRYGLLAAPYMIALSCDLPFVDELTFNHALFGTEAVQLWANPDGSTGNRLIRQPDGFWIGASPRYTRVSGVISVTHLQPWTAGSREPAVWLNPWASQPLTSALPWRSTTIDLTAGRFVTREAEKTAAEILGLSADWPGTGPPFTEFQ